MTGAAWVQEQRQRLRAEATTYHEQVLGVVARLLVHRSIVFVVSTPIEDDRESRGDVAYYATSLTRDMNDLWTLLESRGFLVNRTAGSVRLPAEEAP